MIKDKRFKALDHWWLSGPSYNTYVLSYLSRISALGYTAPSASRLLALNTLTNSLSSVLTKLDVFYVLALNDAGLSNAASLNIKNPLLYQGSYVNSPTYGTTGVTGNASTSYFDTNYNPATNGVNYTLNSASRFTHVYTVGSGTAIDGNTAGSNGSVLSSSVVHRINASFNNLSSAVDLSGTGYKGVNRLDSTNVELYEDLTKSSRTQTSTSIQSGNQLVGRNGATYSSNTFSMYGMGAYLSEVENNLVRNSFATYLTAIGL